MLYGRLDWKESFFHLGRDVRETGRHVPWLMRRGPSSEPCGMPIPDKNYINDCLFKTCCPRRKVSSSSPNMQRLFVCVHSEILNGYKIETNSKLQIGVIVERLVTSLPFVKFNKHIKHIFFLFIIMWSTFSCAFKNSVEQLHGCYVFFYFILTAFNITNSVQHGAETWRGSSCQITLISNMSLDIHTHPVS